jgi:Protein of unknown function (DUF3363)
VVDRSIEADTHLIYRDTRNGESIRGAYRRSLDLARGRFAALDDGVGFSLVPWRPVMGEHLGRELSGRVVGTEKAAELCSQNRASVIAVRCDASIVGRTFEELRGPGPHHHGRAVFKSDSN